METHINRTRWTATFLLAFGLLVAGGPQPSVAQDRAPLSNVVVTGNGTATYGTVFADGEDPFQNDFGATLAPILLYDMPGDLLFEAHLSYELEGGGTSTALEYAQVDYQGFENVQITAGKFLLPFGLFGERYHAAWINKLPSMPLLYGHAHGGVPGRAQLPVLSDVGVMGRFTGSLSGSWDVNASVWVSQGPSQVTTGEEAGDDHAHAAIGVPPARAAPGHGGGSASGAFDIPDVAYGANFSDNNDNKMVGARLGLVRGGAFEIYASSYHAMYDAGDYLDVYGSNLALAWRPSGFEIRGAGTIVWQEFRHDGAFVTAREPGYYLQGSRRFGAFEPVVRWSHLLEPRVDAESAGAADEELDIGLNYWLSASSVVKPALRINPDGSEQLVVQMAVGF